MKYKQLLFLFLIATSTGVFAQVQIDKQLQLTGTGDNARIAGIDSVAASTDATNVKVLQEGRLVFAPSAGSGGNYVINLAPAITTLKTGAIVNFKANHATPGVTTLNVNSSGAIAVKKYVTSDLAANDIKTDQMVSVIYDGTNFQMLSQSGNAAGIESLTQSQINGLTPSTGQTVYNTTTGCLNYYNGTAWKETCGSTPVTPYATANDAYWAQKSLGFNPVSIGGGSTVYTYDATNHFYKNGTDVLIPNKSAVANGQIISNFSFYGFSGGSASSSNYQWDNSTILSQPNVYDVNQMFVSPQSASIINYCAALQFTGGSCSSTTIDGPSGTLLYPLSSPGSGTYDLYSAAEQINAGNIKGTGSNQFISQQQLAPTSVESYCVHTYGKGWRMPTDIETGHSSDGEGGGGGIQAGYQGNGDWIWTTTGTSSGPGTRWVLGPGWYRSGAVPVIDQGYSYVRCVFSAQ